LFSLAVEGGANEVRIIGDAVTNSSLFNPKLAARYGYTLRKISDDTVEWVKILP
jgi:hypothetical protein